MEIGRTLRRLLPASWRRQGTPEYKVVLADYYSALASAGIYQNYRAKQWPVERAVAEAYERLVYVFKAVEAIALHSSRLPFRLYQNEEEVVDHPLFRVLNKRANPLETGPQLRKRLAAQVLLSKRGAFVEVTKSRGGDIVRMDLLPPGRTRPIPGTGDTLISHYEVIQADGTPREIEPERVRWFREPHPLDPWSGVTPLEAAGLSVELDFFARLYNVAFLRNDARPGGVLAIDGEMDQAEMDRIEARFKRGPVEAGKLTVINGQVSYVDLATRPRDLQHSETAKLARDEILTAFGVPESVIGHAADRTYENAEQEEFNFWTITMTPFLRLLETGFDEDSDDDLEGRHDISQVEVLRRIDHARREEARKEFELGLISVNEYRAIAGKEPVDMPRARALYLPSGKTVVATSEADQKALDEEAAEKLAVQSRAQDMVADPGKPGRPGVAGVIPRRRLPSQALRPGLPPGQSERRPAAREPAREPARKELEAAEVKAEAAEEATPVLRLVRGRVKEIGASERVSEPDLQARDKLEIALSAALSALMVRLAERTAARLTSPKTRKGTRHWQAQDPADTRVGTKQIDSGSAVDPQRWEQEAGAASQVLLEVAVAAAAAGLLADLGEDEGLLELGAAQRLLATLVNEIAGTVAASFGGSARRLVESIAEMDLAGEPIEAITGRVRAWPGASAGWIDGLAVAAASAAVNGGRDAIAEVLAQETGAKIRREWRTRRDAQVRPTHVLAGGQTRLLGEDFEVGESWLRYPGDPDGPPEETRNCRCWLAHRSLVTGRFVSPPAGSPTRAASGF